MTDKNDDFASMLEEFEREQGRPNPKKKTREPQPGDTVRGRVVSIGRDTVFVELGYKSDGVMEIADVTDDDGKLTVQVGDEIEARVVETQGKSGAVVLRRMLGRGKIESAELQQAYEHQIPVEGLVSGVNKGGLEVQVAGVRAFCPMSQIDLRPVEDAAALVGQRLQFRITKYQIGSRGLDVVVSRRALLEEEQAERAQRTREQLAPGAVVRGRVTAIKDYGAFVDLGGIEGMLHVSELGFQRVKHPSELLSVGQEVEVAVLRLEKSDDPRKPERVALSLKSLEKDPWSDLEQRFPEGTRASGKVARLETFGAFVEIAPGVEGLLHVSELPGKRNVRHAREVFKVGEAVEVVVQGIDRERRRISLAMATGDEGGAPPPAAPAKLGTLGDLFGKATKKKK